MDRTDSAPSQLKLTVFLSTIYVNAFVLGAVIMGYEMLGSRYLSPYFGGDIYTWGALISTVLLSMMAGAYAGGHLADRHPSTTFLGSMVAAAGVFFFILPTFSDALFTYLSDAIEDVHLGVLIAAFLLNIIPVTVLGVYTPFAVRLMIRFSAGTGRLVGSVSAVSTFGSIVEGKGRPKKRGPRHSDRGDDYRPPPPPGADAPPGAPAPPPRHEDDTFGDW